MNIFNNKDIKKLFISISCISAGFICVSQLIIWMFYNTFNLALLFFSILTTIGILVSCFYYFKKQDQSIEDAIDKMNLFLSGDTDVRLECDYEGSLYKLFHAVNTLATTLNAHATKEQKIKEFLKDTISDISHQLKTPLAALNIYNGLLQDESEDIDAIHDFAVKSEREIDRIELLIQSLLKITKLDAGTIIIERSSENISNIMKDIHLSFEPRIIQEQKKIILSGEEDIDLVCDRVWMSEAISNIVKNALDHINTGGTVWIEWKKLSAVTQIIIKDDGSGVHPEDIHHIFKRFYRSRFSKETQGIGLGLPLAKSIVEAHDGNITVESVIGIGSTFTMSFLNLTKM